MKISETGFCNYERLDTAQSDDRGIYIWQETHVGTTASSKCFYEEQVEGSGLRATRFCRAPSTWDLYDGINCATRSTAELRNLSREIKSVRYWGLCLLMSLKVKLYNCSIWKFEQIKKRYTKSFSHIKGNLCRNFVHTGHAKWAGLRAIFT